MLQSNEFKGATLAEAVRGATAAYDRRGACERKDRRRCNDLIREIAFLQDEAGDLAREAERVEDFAERLKRNARRDLIISAIAALSTVGIVARGLARAWRIINKKKQGELTARDIADVLAALTPLGPAYIAVDSILQLREAEELVRKAETLERHSELLAKGLEEALRDYERYGCGAAQDVS